MAKLPKKAAERIAAGMKRFQPILESARSRDVNESDTVVIVTDLLQEVFGYDKYTEITSEHQVKSTFCDLAVKLEGSLAYLIEVKAVGIELKDQHVRQAVDYAANKGTEWVVLTNGITWRIYRVIFGKPIEHELVIEMNLLTMNFRDNDSLETLGLIAKEGWQRDHLEEYHTQIQALSRFTLAALLLSDPVLEVLRREVRRISPNVRVDLEQIRGVLTHDVLKREVMEGEKAAAAKKQAARAASKALRTTKTEGGSEAPPEPAEGVATEAADPSATPTP